MAVYIPKNGLDFTLRKKRTYRSVCRNYKPLDFASWKQADSFARCDIFFSRLDCAHQGRNQDFFKAGGGLQSVNRYLRMKKQSAVIFVMKKR